MDLRLQRLTGLEIETLRKEYTGLLKAIEKLEAILADPKKLMKVVKNELLEVAQKYGDDRRTTIEHPNNVVEAVSITQEHVAEIATVTFTRAGYLRRMYPKFYQKLPPVNAENNNWDDLPLWQFDTDTDRTLYLFTNLGNCYQLGVEALQESNKPAQRGSLLTGVIAGIEPEETPVQMLCHTAEELAALPDLLFITRQGQLKRTPAKEYDVRRQKFAAVNLREGDSLLTVLPIDTTLDLLLLTKEGMSIRIHTDKISVMGRTTAGVRGITLENGDEVIYASQFQPSDQLLLVSERGYAKRILYMDFEPQARGGKGVKAFYFNKSGSNGTYIAGAQTLSAEPGDVLITQKRSAPTVLPASEVRPQGKQDKGKACVMAILDDVVTGVTPLPGETAEVPEES